MWSASRTLAEATLKTCNRGRPSGELVCRVVCICRVVFAGIYYGTATSAAPIWVSVLLSAIAG
jgi:hypothetical protein